MNITWTKSKKQCVKLSRPIVIDIGSAPQRRTNNNGTTTTKHIWVEIRVSGYGFDFDYYGDERKFKFHSSYQRYTMPFFNNRGIKININDNIWSSK